MKNKDLYSAALDELNAKKKDYDEKGIFNYQCINGVAMFLLAISPNGVLLITEYTPGKLKSHIRPEATDSGVELTFELPSIKGRTSVLQSLLIYLNSVKDCVYAMQQVIDEKVNYAKINKELYEEKEDEK